MLKPLLDIIIVEDNPADIETTLDALYENRLINKVEVLKDGEVAIDYIFGQRIHRRFDIFEGPTLILLSLRLPKIDGIEILRRIRSDGLRKNIPVIVLTSSRSDQDRLQSFRLGVNGYFVKPIKFERFVNSVVQVGYHWASRKSRPR